MKKECPRCGQGVLLVATIKMSDERVVVCDECEALWTSEKEPASANFQDMVTFLKSKGIDGAWNALAIEEGGKTA
jgi:uncharacterized protein (DUF983 family)